jgi:hypothetical protein
VQREARRGSIVVSKSTASEISARIQGGLHEKLIRSSLCAVWGASSLPEFAAQESMKNVLAPVAFDSGSAAVARLAGSIAEAQRGCVRLLHVILTEPSYLEVNRDLYGFAADEPWYCSRGPQPEEQSIASRRIARGIPHGGVVVVATTGRRSRGKKVK